VNQFKARVREGSIYSVEKFNLYDPKKSYRAVDYPLRICFTPRTIVREVASPPEDFPVFAYSALPFAVLADRVENNVMLAGMPVAALPCRLHVSFDVCDLCFL
jgi:hypothetical protein